MDEELISTEDLEKATHYLDQIIETVREAHTDGIPIDVETLTAMMLKGIFSTEIPPQVVICQQALMLCITIQRLAR